jgi:hypothetical protein
MLTTPHCKESLSRAYVTAVVGRARHKVNWNSEFDYGVDGYVRIIEKRGTRHYETGLGFDFQSKTTTNWTREGEEIVYDLEADAYNDLSARAGMGALPFLLVLLCIPKDEAVWLDVSADRMILQSALTGFSWMECSQKTLQLAESEFRLQTCSRQQRSLKSYTPSKQER